MPEPQGDSWVAYSQYVLKTLERIIKNQEALDDKVDAINNRLIALEIRSAMWGALGGLVVGGVAAFVMDRVLR